MRVMMLLTGAGLLAFGIAWSLGCCSAPEATSLPDDESEIKVVGGDDPAVMPVAGSPPPVRPATRPVAPTQAPAPRTTAGGLPPPTVRDTPPGTRPNPAPRARPLQPPPAAPAPSTTPEPAPIAPEPSEPPSQAPPSQAPPSQAAPTQAPPTQAPATPTPAMEPEAPPTAPSAPDAPVHTPIPEAVSYAALELRKVKGGQIQFQVPGTPDEVLAMLVDFPNMSGRRSWAPSQRVLARDAEGVLTEWKFKGRMGIHPTVHVHFRTERSQDGGVVTFELRKKALGIGSFFGDYKVKRLPGTPARCLVVERTFLDSGLPFANASREDLEEGHRKDAELMRTWMEERAAGK